MMLFIRKMRKNQLDQNDVMKVVRMLSCQNDVTDKQITLS